MNIRWLLSGLVLGLALSTGAPVVQADDDDDDDYRRRWRRNRVYSTSYVPGYVSPLGYRSSVYGAPLGYRTYSTYNPYWNSGYGFYDRGGYRYYRDDTGSIVGRVLLNTILNRAF